jgi:hypothetical protein
MSLINFKEYTYGDRSIPEHMREGVENYLLHGIEPGGFMRSVICNDLMGAANKADHVNRQELGHIARWIVLEFPPGSFGSVNRYQDWINDVNGHRSAFAKQIEQDAIIDILSYEQPPTS